MILIYPPVTKCCEPPGGVALLSGALKAHGFQSEIVDANIEGLLWLARSSSHSGDAWTQRAVAHFEKNILDLKEDGVYQNHGRYTQRMMDVNRVITTALPERFRVTLSDYRDNQLFPVKSRDLFISAENFRENPFYPYFETVLLQRIENSEFPWVGLSLCFLSQALTGFALAGWIRSRFPQKKIIMGGGLITSWMSSPQWKNPFHSLVHRMVKGAGEEILVSLADAFIRNKDGGLNTDTSSPVSVPFPDVPVPAFDRTDGPGPSVHNRSVDCPAVPVPVVHNSDVHHRPAHCPAWSSAGYLPDFDFCRWDRYLSPGRVLPYRTSIGCYWGKCRFCPEKAENSRFRKGNNREIMDQLHFLCQKYRINYVHFLDNALSPSFLKALTLEKKVPFLWYGFVKFSRELADQNFCRQLYKSGCRMLKLGLESGDQKVLDRMNKGTDLETASRVLTSLNNAGISAYVYILFGTTFENEASAEKTLSYVAAHSDRIDFLNTAIFNLPRFSREAQELHTRLFYKGDLSLYTAFKHPDNWDRKRVRQFVDKRFKKTPLIARILRNNPPFFSSSHAVFLGSIHRAASSETSLTAMP
ncbi:MAG: radical SAM protein [Desulfobacteraceae bacterium]